MKILLQTIAMLPAWNHNHQNLLKDNHFPDDRKLVCFSFLNEIVPNWKIVNREVSILEFWVRICQAVLASAKLSR